MRSKPVFAVGISLLMGSTSYCQNVLYLQGAQVTTMPGSLVHVNGAVRSAGGNVLHNGTMEVTGDWTNTTADDSVFLPSSKGLVVMINPSLQKIGGTVTNFPSLTFAPEDPQATKLLTATTLVEGTLNLTDNLLDVNGNDMYVRNSTPSAMQYTADTGYVTTSNSPNGRLLQDVAAAASYNFPLGGGSTYRYRPLTINSQNDGTIATQFQDYDADNDGYNREHIIGSFKNINPNFYHTIEFVNSAGSAEVLIPYSSSDDGGIYSALAQWKFSDHWELTNNYMNAPVATSFGTDQQMSYTMVDTGKNIVALADSIENNNFLFVANAFSPNGDNRNDYFAIKGLENYRYNEVKVYNRWGQLLMSERNYQNDWQGNNLDIGTYMYTLKVVDNMGVEHFYKGDVTVVR